MERMIQIRRSFPAIGEMLFVKWRNTYLLCNELARPIQTFCQHRLHAFAVTFH